MDDGQFGSKLSQSGRFTFKAPSSLVAQSSPALQVNVQFAAVLQSSDDGRDGFS
jgi:hypothetical protein